MYFCNIQIFEYDIKTNYIQQIFPIIFPTGETLNLLQNYFKNKKEKIYQTLAVAIENILKVTP